MTKPQRKMTRAPIPRIHKNKLSKFSLSSEDAEKRAEWFKMGEGKTPEPDPCKSIKPSLLSADHIIEYVNQTGMVAPFDALGGKKSRLKAASYSGRIGKVAYRYDIDDNDPKKIIIAKDGYLDIPANSIVFVECDLDFRLPPFIAIRFNLHITHVHRGLLLGTGPLVDPGFHGKLCIPLHNLTNKPYRLPVIKGLIWVEFTKTTSLPSVGRVPSNDGFWDIKDFIDKSSQQYNKLKAPIPIRSSIPDMMAIANKKLTAATVAASESKDHAAKAAKDVENQANTMRNWSVGSAVASVIAVASITLAAIALSFGSQNDVRTLTNEITPKLTNIDDKISDHLQNIEISAKTNSETSATVSDTSTKLKDSLTRIEELENQNAQQEKENKELRERMEKLEQQMQGQQPEPP